MEKNVQGTDWSVQVQINIHSIEEKNLQGNDSDLTEMFRCWGKESRQKPAVMIKRFLVSMVLF